MSESEIKQEGVNESAVDKMVEKTEKKAKALDKPAAEYPKRLSDRTLDGQIKSAKRKMDASKEAGDKSAYAQSKGWYDVCVAEATARSKKPNSPFNPKNKPTPKEE